MLVSGDRVVLATSHAGPRGAEDREALRAELAEAARALGVSGEPIAEPVVVPGRGEEAEQLVQDDRIFALGDAAFHLSSAQGLFLNLGINDGLRFAQLWQRLKGVPHASAQARRLIARFASARRKTNALLSKKEAIVGRLWGKQVGPLRGPASNAAMALTAEAMIRFTGADRTPFSGAMIAGLRTAARMHEALADLPLMRSMTVAPMLDTAASLLHRAADHHDGAVRRPTPRRVR
jgi:hypothetical protein